MAPIGSRLAVLFVAVGLLFSGQAAVAAGQSHAQPGGVVTGAYTWRPELDPQMAWSNYSLGVIYDTYIPLLTYEHAGGKAGTTVIPGLARSLPRIGDGGRTYTLFLRKGLRYSNGEPVRASDFKFSVERMFRANARAGFYGPEGFYEDIVGAGRFERTLRGGIRGITADDRSGRIVIHLVRPERSFSRKLAMTFAAPVPPGTPAHNLSFDPPPATGPYVITDSSRRGWTYERNPEWNSHDQRLLPRIPSGHLGTIKIKVIRGRAKAIREVANGKVDWLSEGMSGLELLSLRHRFPTRVRLEPTLGVEYFWLNTSRAPFDDVRVRRAVNYAVDRAVFAQLSGGQMAPTEQILPPDLPGYRKLSPYPHDMAKARRLIAAADPTDHDVTLWTYGDKTEPTDAEFAVYLGTVLEELGFTVHLKVLHAESYYALIGDSRRRDLNAGIGNFYSNYPDPDDFFRDTLGSPVTPFYNENLAQFFSPGLSATMERLARRPGPSMPEGAYAALDRAYTEQAPWVPIGGIRVPLFVSRRIDLPKVISNPEFGVDITSLRVGR